MIAAALDRLWDAVGRPDPGPVEIAAVARRRSGNDALAAPAGFGGPPPDLDVPVFAIPAARLGAIVDAVALAEPGAERLPAPDGRPRYRVRSRLLRFPDLIEVEVIPRGQAASTLALYSRSLVGSRDFGVNRARLRRWLARIGQEAGRP